MACYNVVLLLIFFEYKRIYCMNIIYEENILIAQDFMALRESVGFRAVDKNQAEKAIENGLYNIIAKEGNK